MGMDRLQQGGMGMQQVPPGMGQGGMGQVGQPGMPPGMEQMGQQALQNPPMGMTQSMDPGRIRALIEALNSIQTL